jgi:hypothetical protein
MALLAITAVAAMTAAAAGASTIYNNTPKPKPKNLVSLGFEATQTSEFGGAVSFAGTARTNPTITVTMSSWACQNLLGGVNCATSSGATFAWPITLNVYEIGPGNTQGALIATETQTVNVPYRPSANNKHCTPNAEGAVGYGGSCFHGLAFKVPFVLTGAVLPNEAIVSVAYNTTDYGAAPTHAKDIGEDSLNLGLTEPPETPSVGSDPLPENAFKNSVIEGGWEGFQPVYKVSAKNK